MPSATGSVTNIEVRTVTTKYGPKSNWDVYVDGSKFNWGWKDPVKSSVSKGAALSFDYTTGKYGNVIDVASVRVTSAGTGAVATPVLTEIRTPASGGGFRDIGFPVPARSDKISILRQNALTNARELVCALPKVFGIDNSSACDDVVAVVLDVARTFADYTSGRDLEEKIEAVVSEMEKGNDPH